MWNISMKKLKNKKKIDVPEELFTKCPSCQITLTTNKFEENDMICPECGYELRITARQRIELIVDKGTFKERYKNNHIINPLDFPEYEEKIIDLREKTKLDEAIIGGTAKIGGSEFVIGVMDSDFIMGSMGTAVGEKITKLFEFAIRYNLPVVLYTTSGGARMQEGILSLMQMAKVSAVIKRHNEKGLFYMPIFYFNHN